MIINRICLRASLALLAAAPTLSAQPRILFQESFELYPLEETIAGRTTDGRGWRVAGMMEGDLAVVTAVDAAEGKQSLLLSDMSAGRVRAVLDMEPMSAGSVSVAVKEHADDDRTPDAYSITLGAVTLLRKPDAHAFWFTLGKGRGRTVKFSGPSHAYVQEQWNRLRVDFDDTTKTAVFFINDVEAARLENQSADLTVRGLVFATYSSSSIGDAIFVDDIVASVDGSAATPDAGASP